ASAAAVDGVGVDGALAGGRLPADAQRAAGRAEGPGVPDHRLAVVAVRQQQLALGSAIPENLDLWIDVRRGRRQALLDRHQASSCPRIKVALPMRVPSEPPVPWTSATWQSGTWTSGWAVPSSWRTASSTFIIPPMPGWLLQRPP